MPTSNNYTFADLKLIEPLLRAVRSEGYTQPTPIQIQAIPHVLAGRDLLGCAQTGTGKTAAFALPILQRLAVTTHHQHHRRPHIRVLVLSPTRELASQIGESFDIYGRHTGLRQATIFGGVGQTPQVQALQRGVDILVATPGRLLDLITQGLVQLNLLEVFVLDEADRMLDMGFIHVEKNDKPALLQHLLRDSAVTRALVFTRTKHGADRVVKQLRRTPSVGVEAIHGNKSQSARERALANFKNGDIRVLVATDIAARGIDVESISHVINYDLPNIPETYVHRIGRTGRAGASGMAFSFCDTEERAYLVDIERLTQQHVPVVLDHPYRSLLAPPPPTDLNPRGRRGDSRPASAAPDKGTSRDKKHYSRRGEQAHVGGQSAAASPPARSHPASPKTQSHRPNRRRRWYKSSSGS
ncbi:MAG: DEAD/DEAH box helicase [Chloroflexi bacterium]|nr:DEAD/DEAH box helicase [Chloroflexota bacterium]